MVKLYTRTSVFSNAPTKAEALSKLKTHYKGLNYKVHKVTNWYGGKKGDKVGKSYWFDLKLIDTTR